MLIYTNIMNKYIYSQLDKRWYSLPYPTSNSLFGKNACGCCSCLHVLMELQQYQDYTPKTIRKYVMKYAVPRQGTTHEGISKSLTHYGFKTINHGGDFAGAFRTLDKRKRCWGVILVHSGSNRSGITWTSGGHYIAFVDYKKKDGKHYLYIKDSGYRKHSGWYCYENDLKGSADTIWTATSNAALASGKYYAKTAKLNTGKNTGPEDNGNNDNEPEVTLTVNWEALNPYIVAISKDTKKFDPKLLKGKKVIGCVIQAGEYLNKNRAVNSTFRSPKVYEQTKACIENNLDFGYWLTSRVKSAAEVEKEMYQLSFLVRKYPPTMGVWIDIGFDNKKHLNDIIFTQYEKELVRLGMSDKMGIHCNRKFLDKFSWSSFQDRWWLWLDDPVKHTSDFEKLLDPKFFDTDGLSGPIIGEDGSSVFNVGNDNKSGDGSKGGAGGKTITSTKGFKYLGKYRVTEFCPCCNSPAGSYAGAWGRCQNGDVAVPRGMWNSFNDARVRAGKVRVIIGNKEYRVRDKCGTDAFDIFRDTPRKCKCSLNTHKKVWIKK